MLALTIIWINQKFIVAYSKELKKEMRLEKICENYLVERVCFRRVACLRRSVDVCFERECQLVGLADCIRLQNNLTPPWNALPSYSTTSVPLRSAKSCSNKEV